MRIIISLLLVLAIFATASPRLTYDALIRSAKIYLKEIPKNYDSAVEKLEQAIDQYADKPPIEAYLILGSIHADKRRYAEMDKNFDAVDSICTNATDKDAIKDCENLEVTKRVGQIRQAQWIEEFNAGASLLGETKEYESEYGELEDSDDKLDLLYDLELIYRDAQRNFDNSTVILGDSAQGWINLGITYYRLADVYNRIGSLDDQAEFDPASTPIIKDSALVFYRQALERKPDNFDLMSNMATIYFELQQWEECADMFGRMASLRPENVSVLQNLAMLLSRLDMTDSAKVIVDRVLELDPDNRDMRLQRGYDEVSIGADLNSEINRLKAEDAPQAKIDSVIELRNVAYRQVIEDFGKVTEIESDNYDAWYFLGLCHYFLEDYEESRDSWEEAARISPEKTEIWELLAPLYLKLKQPEKSREAQKKVEELQAKEGSGR